MMDITSAEIEALRAHPLRGVNDLHGRHWTPRQALELLRQIEDVRQSSQCGENRRSPRKYAVNICVFAKYLLDVAAGYMCSLSGDKLRKGDRK
jgi:hypothetical protein